MKDTIAAYLLEKRASGRAPSTLYSYELYLTAFSGHCGKPLPSVVNTDVARWIVAEQMRGLSSRSILARHKTLRIFFNWCVENEHLIRTPMKMKAPKPPTDRPRVAALEHIQQLLAIPARVWFDYRDRAIIALMLDTGMRAGEVAGLLLSHLDLRRRLVHVPPGKDKTARSVPFTDSCAEFVSDYLEHRPWRNDCLFQRVRMPTGMIGSDVRVLLEKRCAELGIVPYVNAHSIRHLFAMKALNDGIRIEVVSKILGHATVDFTLKMYASLLMSTIQQEYNLHWRA